MIKIILAAALCFAGPSVVHWTTANFQYVSGFIPVVYFTAGVALAFDWR